MLTRAHLHDEQRYIVDLIRENKRLAVWASMGVGKTVSTLTALDDLSLVEDVFPALILGPKRVAKTVWSTESQQWEHLKHLKVACMVGSESERKAALKLDWPIVTCNYDVLNWLIDYLGDEWPFKTIVCDEASRLSGFRLRQGSVRMRALGKVAWRSERFIELTGSPAANGLQKLWGQGWFLDKGERLGHSFAAFDARWFKVGFDGFGREPMKHAQAEIESKLRDVCHTIAVPPAPEPIQNIIHVDLPPKVRAQYKQMEKEFFIELEAGDIEAANAAVRSQKLLELANGAIYHDEDKNWTEMHDAKLEALDSIVEEANGQPVLLAYQFVHDKERILKKFPFARFLDDKQKTVDEWNEGKIRLLVAHPASAGHGLNLQHGGNILVRFGMGWNLETHEQIIERIGPRRQMQSGYDRPVYEHIILARDTVDEAVLERIEKKHSVQQALLEAMKRRRG